MVNPTIPLDDDQEENEDIHAHGFTPYVPSQVRSWFPQALPHPAPIVETLTLSTVSLPKLKQPKLNFDARVINEGRLSDLQLESILYANAAHEVMLPCPSGTLERKAFFIGDGAGVGKGRQLSGIISHNYKDGREKHIWVSVSKDLELDARRDLDDVLATRVKTFNLKLTSYNKPIPHGSGVLFLTYSMLRAVNKKSRFRSRIDQIVDWCGPGFSGCLMFDECHRAKNLVSKSGKPSQSAAAVVELQSRLPSARIVYCSATGACEPTNMAYMTRLGLWGPGTPFVGGFPHFLREMERRGMGMMELLATHLKTQGSFISRVLSYEQCEFELHECNLSPHFRKMYNDATRIWDRIFTLKEITPTAKEVKFIWSSHQAFFKQLCVASKVDYVVEASGQALAEGYSIVIGLQMTGENGMNDATEKAKSKHFSCMYSALRRSLYMVLENIFGPPPNDLDLYKTHDVSESEDSFIAGLSACSSDDAPTVKLADILKSIGTKRNRKPVIYAMRNESDTETDSDIAQSHTRASKRVLIHNSDSTDTVTSTKGTKDDAIDLASDSDDSEFSVLSLSSDSNTGPEVETGSTDRPMCNVNDSDIVDLTLSTSDSDEVGPSIAEASFLEEEECYMSILAPRAERFVNIISSKQKTLAAPSDSVEALWNDVASLQIPANPLDDLVDRLGGASAVSEMTGRSSRMVRGKSRGKDRFTMKSRAGNGVSLDKQNLYEKKCFMSRKKRIAIISDAASSGISLHADRRCKNQEKRVHITLELPWSADKAIQQLGRTNRSNQTQGPVYRMLVSPIGGEKRFVASVCKRLASLGALTQGDRRASTGIQSQISQFDLDNASGRSALKLLYSYCRNADSALTPKVPEITLELGIRLEAAKEVLHREFVPSYADYRSRLEGLVWRITKFFHVNMPLNVDWFENAMELVADGKCSYDDLLTALEPIVPDTYHYELKSLLFGQTSSTVDSIASEMTFFKCAYTWLSSVGIDCSETDSKPSVTRFLNRILGLEIEKQNYLFTYFTDLVEYVIAEEKREGRYDGGVVELKGREVFTVVVDKHLYGGQLNYVQVRVDRGCSWDAVQTLIGELGEDDLKAFYIPIRQSYSSEIIYAYNSTRKNRVSVIRPSTGLSTMPSFRLSKYYMRVDMSVEGSAMTTLLSWKKQFQLSMEYCYHYRKNGNMCKHGHECMTGKRMQTFHVLTKNLISTWVHLNGIFEELYIRERHLPIVRACDTSTGLSLIGMKIPVKHVDSIVAKLSCH